MDLTKKEKISGWKNTLRQPRQQRQIKRWPVNIESISSYEWKEQDKLNTWVCSIFRSERECFSSAMKRWKNSWTSHWISVSILSTWINSLG